MKEIPVIKASELTEEQQREFIIKDNVGFGEWDWEMIANEWDAEQLAEWGVDVPIFDNESAIIEPSGYDLSNNWFLNIQFENENECQEWYDKLTNEGLICKIVQ
jgi:hypothetical protein